MNVGGVRVPSNPDLFWRSSWNARQLSEATSIDAEFSRSFQFVSPLFSVEPFPCPGWKTHSGGVPGAWTFSGRLLL